MGVGRYQGDTFLPLLSGIFRYDKYGGLVNAIAYFSINGSVKGKRIKNKHRLINDNGLSH